MNQTHVRWRVDAQPTIDITPGAVWRRGVRRAGAALVLAVALPLLWLFGALTLLALLGGVAVMLLWSVVRQAMRPGGRPRQGHRSGAADEHGS